MLASNTKRNRKKRVRNFLMKSTEKTYPNLSQFRINGIENSNV
jgi:hypothetical protein